MAVETAKCESDCSYPYLETYLVTKDLELKKKQRLQWLQSLPELQQHEWNPNSL